MKKTQKESEFNWDEVIPFATKSYTIEELKGSRFCMKKNGEIYILPLQGGCGFNKLLSADESRKIKSSTLKESRICQRKNGDIYAIPLEAGCGFNKELTLEEYQELTGQNINKSNRKISYG